MNSPPDLSKARQTKLHASGQALLYDVAKRVRSGYHWWTAGEVAAEKVLGLVAKLDHQYHTSADTVTRHRRKKSGDTSTTLFVWPLRNDPAGYTTRFGFLLLSTEHLDGEVMYDARRRPARVNLYANEGAVFHLIPTETTITRSTRKPGRKPKRNRDEEVPKPQTQKVKTVVFDWQLSAKSLDLMRQRYTAAASNPAALDQLRRAYSALPMVAGFRSQFRTVLVETRPLWKRATTPQVQEAKRAIKEGRRSDPFESSSLPFIRGFPKLYDSPPVTLAAYLDANQQARKAQEKRNLERVQADHAAPTIPDFSAASEPEGERP